MSFDFRIPISDLGARAGACETRRAFQVSGLEFRAWFGIRYSALVSFIAGLLVLCSPPQAPAHSGSQNVFYEGNIGPYAARVIINERTGTVVAGGDVRLLPVAIAQGGITISVRERAEVSQPGPLSSGKTEVVTQTDIETQEPRPEVVYLDGAASLADVAKALSSFGVSPRELASILQALRSAGALRAEIIVQ